MISALMPCRCCACWSVLLVCVVGVCWCCVWLLCVVVVVSVGVMRDGTLSNLMMSLMQNFFLTIEGGRGIVVVCLRQFHILKISTTNARHLMMSRAVLPVRVISHLIPLGRVALGGGKLIAQVISTLLLYRTGQWITPLLYISTARMHGRHPCATTRVFMARVVSGYGHALRLSRLKESPKSLTIKGLRTSRRAGYAINR